MDSQQTEAQTTEPTANFDQDIFAALDAARGTNQKFTVAVLFRIPSPPPRHSVPLLSRYTCRRDWRDATGVFYADHYKVWCRTVRQRCHKHGLAVEDMTRSGGVAVVHGLSDNIFALASWDLVGGVYDPHKIYEIALMDSFI